MISPVNRIVENFVKEMPPLPLYYRAKSVEIFFSELISRQNLEQAEREMILTRIKPILGTTIKLENIENEVQRTDLNHEDRAILEKALLLYGKNGANENYEEAQILLNIYRENQFKRARQPLSHVEVHLAPITTKSRRPIDVDAIYSRILVLAKDALQLKTTDCKTAVHQLMTMLEPYI